jgi:aminoglycoside 6'-N-acetyltransferase I
MIIEPYTPERLEDWVQMRKALWPEDSVAEHRRYAIALSGKADDAVVYFVRESSNNVVAFAEATLRRDHVNGCSSSPVGFLEGLYVRPNYRRRGVAHLLCDAVERWTQSKGCTELASDVLLHNELGMRVHEALGFAESDRVVFYSKRI